jgi:hypothetical protein
MGNDNRTMGVERWRENHVHTHVNLSGTNDTERWGTGSRVALDLFPDRRIQVRVDVCKKGSRA